MNKSFIKLLTDFGPLIIFFTVYYKGGKNLETAIKSGEFDPFGGKFSVGELLGMNKYLPGIDAQVPN